MIRVWVKSKILIAVLLTPPLQAAVNLPASVNEVGTLIVARTMWEKMHAMSHHCIQSGPATLHCVFDHSAINVEFVPPEVFPALNKVAHSKREVRREQKAH